MRMTGSSTNSEIELSEVSEVLRRKKKQEGEVPPKM
jgi:hypothetical protein